MPRPFMGPKWFWTVQIILLWHQLFWTGLNHFGKVQIIKVSPEKPNLNLTKMIWTRLKQFALNQNNLYPSKSIWMVQNDFGTIGGQGKSI